MKNTRWNTPMYTFYMIIFCFIILFIWFAYLSLSPTVFGKDMDQFALNRNTVKKTVYASRGNIYDSNGDKLALNVSSYTLIAYLEKSSIYNGENYIHDIEDTAERLAPIIGAEAEYIKSILSADLFQVEFGVYGSGITELKKEEIESLNIRGLDFTETQKRFYPNGDFASYLIGYAKKNTDGKIVGELGIEAFYDDILEGTDGYREYQKDMYGYKIPNTKEVSIDATDGNDIYLTIDSNIQRFVETEIKAVQETYNPEWINITVMDAKTGEILGSSSTPSFDPNIRDITNYENPLVSVPFEPGSTMKIYTYMCAMENGIYNGDDTFLSGRIAIGNDYVYDWNNKGWGTITYDLGFEYSSNVAATLLAQELGKDKLNACLVKYGFGEETGIELPREGSGALNFNYDIEIASAGFGQGITTTPIQHLQALSIIANNGTMLTPYIIKEVKDNAGEVVYSGETKRSEELVSSDTIEHIKELMYNVVQGENIGTTGYPYKIEGLDVIAKTGTSQIYDYASGTYLSGANDYIYSFAGMFPKSDPEYIIYAAAKKPTWGQGNTLYKSVKNLSKSIAKYKNLEQEQELKYNKIEVRNYVNKDVSSLDYLGDSAVILGDGDTIISQSKKPGYSLLPGEKIFILTNYSELKYPNMIGYSRIEIEELAKLIDMKYVLSGYGYVTSQSIKEGIIIGEEIPEFTLDDVYKEKEESEEIINEEEEV